jgi:protein-tyrosine-phosphatase
VNSGAEQPGRVSLLFVCTGNICRSPLAEAFLKDYASKQGQPGRISVSSAGTHAWDGNPATAEASLAGARYGLDLSQHRAREVRRSIIEENDFILAMTIRQHEWLLRAFPESKNKLYLALLFPRRLAGESPEVADVPDPMGESVVFYLNVLEMLQPALPAILGGALREETE